jgi:putative CocE/NonD family hydrolase
LGGDALYRERPRYLKPYTMYYMALHAWPEMDQRLKEACMETDFENIHRRMGIPLEPGFDPDPDSPWWKERRFSKYVHEAPPTVLIGGWYDIFMRDTLEDWRDLQRNGRTNYLIIGPWTHFDATNLKFAGPQMLLGMDFIKSVCNDNPQEVKLPSHVRLAIMSTYIKFTWHDFAQWPPLEATAQPYYLLGNKRLCKDFCSPYTAPRSDVEQDVSPPLSACGQSHCDYYSEYTFDPASPTPSVGGNVFHARGGAGEHDNTELESRQDVLTFTTSPLSEDVVVVGPVKLVVYVKSSTVDNFDIFGRLCDVDKEGISRNVCDGIRRINTLYESKAVALPGRLEGSSYPPLPTQPLPDTLYQERLNNFLEFRRISSGGSGGGSRGGLLSPIFSDDEGQFEEQMEMSAAHGGTNVHTVEVDLGGTGKRFLKGHCIRVQLSSGCHPRFLRNYGNGLTGDQLKKASVFDMKRARIRILHDATFPSCIYLPTLPQDKIPPVTSMYL